MFTPFVLIYTFLLISAVRCSTDPEPTVLNITDEVCLDSGFWTDWFSMYNAESDNPPDAESTYNTLMNIANASCSAIAGIQVQQIVQQMTAGRMSRSSSNLDVVSVFLSVYAEALSKIDFRLRLCCSDGFTGMSTTSDESVTETTTATTDNPATLIETTSSRTTTSEPTLVSLDNVICGKQQIDPRPSLTSRIFGGTDAIANSWPWVSPRDPTLSALLLYRFLLSYLDDQLSVDEIVRK